MKSRTLSATALILLTPLIVLAFQARADQVRRTELKSESDQTGGAQSLILTVSPSLTGQTKPDYSGVWKLKSTASNELLTIEHQEPKISLKYKIDDDQGRRSFEVKAQTDGKEYKQEIQSSPATFIAKWEGDTLTVELKRIATFGPVHNRRILKLSDDRKAITTERIDYSPEGEEVNRRSEIWEKQ